MNRKCDNCKFAREMLDEEALYFDSDYYCTIYGEYVDADSTCRYHKFEGEGENE